MKTEADLLWGGGCGCNWSWRPKERGNSVEKVPNSLNMSRAGPKIQTVTVRAGCDDDGPSNLSPSLQPLNSSISLSLSLSSLSHSFHLCAVTASFQSFLDTWQPCLHQFLFIQSSSYLSRAELTLGIDGCQKLGEDFWYFFLFPIPPSWLSILPRISLAEIYTPSRILIHSKCFLTSK